MIKISRLVAIILFICTPFFYAQAQSGFIEESVWSNIDPATGSASDFIITQGGTKIFGEIARDYDHSDYEEVTFDFNGDVKTYNPSDLQAFGLADGLFFLSKKLPDSSELEFVQVLFSGKLQLDYRRGNYYIDNGVEIQQLKEYHQDLSEGGAKRSRVIKFYTSTLKVLTAGKCSEGLSGLIEKSNLDGQDFIKILTQFHECEEIPYKLHVESIPFVKISPIVSMGIGSSFSYSSEISDNTNFNFSNSIDYRVFAGIRLHDFRRFPRSSIDLRLGYVTRSTTYDASYEVRHEIATGTQQFKESSIVIPLGYNYSIVKNANKEIYVGLVMSAWLSSFNNDQYLIEISNIYGPIETQVFEEQSITLTDNTVNPGIRAGANFPISSKMKLFVELEADYLNDFYFSQLGDSPVFRINRTSVSLQVGIEL